jgi:hypothetical protein
LPPEITAKLDFAGDLSLIAVILFLFLMFSKTFQTLPDIVVKPCGLVFVFCFLKEEEKKELFLLLSLFIIDIFV